MEALQGDKTIEITDIQGKLLLSQESTEQKVDFEISSLAAGTYVVNVKRKDRLYSTEKIVIERK